MIQYMEYIESYNYKIVNTVTLYYILFYIITRHIFSVKQIEQISKIYIKNDPNIILESIFRSYVVLYKPYSILDCNHCNIIYCIPLIPKE